MPSCIINSLHWDPLARGAASHYGPLVRNYARNVDGTGGYELGLQKEEAMTFVTQDTVCQAEY